MNSEMGRFSVCACGQSFSFFFNLGLNGLHDDTLQFASFNFVNFDDKNKLKQKRQNINFKK